MIELVTLDAAGTIIDHSWDPAGLALSAARQVGLDIDEPQARKEYALISEKRKAEHFEVEKRGDPSEIRSFWQGGLASWLNALGQDPELSREIYSICNERTFKMDGSMWRLFPDTLSGLESLRSAGYKVGVISNWDRTLFDVLESLGLSDEFDFVIASMPFGFEKPSKEIFDEALRRSGSRPDAALHVGDDDYDDVLGAKQAGWSALLIDRERPADLAAGRISSLNQVVEFLRA